MKLLALHVANFGKLHEIDESFDQGLNVRLHPNGYGKSTLAVFIKAMLYGLPASTKRSLLENERKRYTPWQGGVFGGSLDIEVDGEEYRIERTFGDVAAADTLSVISLRTGREAESDWTLAPGEGLFGVDAAAYERTTYLSQRPDEYTKDGMQSIHTKLNRLVDATDDLANFDTAMEALEKRRLYYRHRRGEGGAIFAAEQQLAAHDRTIEAAAVQKEALAASRERSEQALLKKQALTQRAEQLHAKEQHLARTGERRAVAERLRALESEVSGLGEALAHMRAELGGHVPTEEQLWTLEQLQAKHRQASAALAHADLGAGDAAELNLLSSRFPYGIPSDDQAMTLRAAAEQLTRAASAAEQQHIDARAPKPRAALLLGVLGLLALIGALLSPYALIAAAALLIGCAVSVLRFVRVKRLYDDMIRAEQHLLQCWTAITPVEPPSRNVALQKTESLLRHSERLAALHQHKEQLSAATQQHRATLVQAEKEMHDVISLFPAAPEDPAKAWHYLVEMRTRLLDGEQRYEQKKQELTALRTQYSEQLCTQDADDASDPTDAAALERERLEIASSLAECEEILAREEQRIEQLGTQLEELSLVEADRAALAAQLEEQRTALSVIDWTQKYLTLSREQLSGRYLATMRERFAYYVNLLTGEDAPVFTMDGEFRVKLRAAGASRSTDSFSTGERDLIALCERLSLLDAMFEGERPFLILDDPFTNLDDDTVARASRLLREIAERYQLLYLTCAESRADALASTNND